MIGKQDLRCVLDPMLSKARAKNSLKQRCIGNCTSATNACQIIGDCSCAASCASCYGPGALNPAAALNKLS